MYSLFAGSICNGLGCTPLYLYSIWHVYRNFIAAFIILVGIVFILRRKHGFFSRIPILIPVLIVVAGVSIITVSVYDTYVAGAGYNKEQQKAAAKIDYDVYEFTYLPHALESRKNYSSVDIDQSTDTASLYYSYGKSDTELDGALKEFNKQTLGTIRNGCDLEGTKYYEDLKSDTTLSEEYKAQKIGAKCEVVGQNNFKESIYREAGSDTLYVTDVGSTRISLFVPTSHSDDWGNEVNTDEVIKMFQSMKKIKATDIKYTQ